MAKTFEEIVADLEEQRHRVLRGGWKRAVVGAFVAIAVVGAIGELVGLLLALGHAVPGLDAAQGARMGWALFYAAHHVGMVFRTPSLHLPIRSAEALEWPAGFPVDGVAAVAFAGMTAVAVWLLARAGRAVAAEAGGTVPRRAVHGMKVAVPYALVSFGAGWTLHLHLRLPHTSPLSFHPSRPASLMWPLTIAALAGLVGGISSVRDELWVSEWWESKSWPKRWHGAFVGGWTMLLAGLGLSFLSLCALAIARPADASAFLHGMFAAGPVAGIGMLILAIAAVPNAASWVLAPAMGGCDQVGGGAGGPLPPYCFVSYSNLVSHRLPAAPRDTYWGFPGIGTAPHAYLAFLAIPAIAVVLGAVRAVRRSEARTGREGLIVGALSGVVFAASFVAVLAVVSVTVRMGGSLFLTTSGYYRYGPYPAYGFGLALAWGALGGAVVGGVLGRLRGPPG
jgi:Family of unknown function (DUF6350)